ncbi:hypothetical protein DM860_008801 [Cuscuta australis]|uniref:Transglycosylase SLT domain-containing protein n=3 Tax=Cuscuta sect. Cleistogrammica TaxID=1824901 RepID=A0A328DAY0_9ASTE|nr:hypothetical protein DM860_008801 [Cuscuta australis]
MGSACFTFWDDCVDPRQLEAMWRDPDVAAEWVSAGETKGSKVHLSRDHEGQPYLTQTEMKAVSSIIVGRHFVSQIDSDMLCAIAELESDRMPLATQYNKKTKEVSMGLMQISLKTAEWIASELGFRAYDVAGNSKLLYYPFVNVYHGAAYLKWLSNYEQKERSEEFIVRAYKGGVKKAAHKSTLVYWKRYLSVKENLPSRNFFELRPLPYAPSTSAAAESEKIGLVNITWDSQTSAHDMEEMWSHPSVSKEWSKSGEKRGNVRFSHDKEKRPYLSRVELRAVAEIIINKYFSARGIKPAVLCGIAEIVCRRYVNGVGQRVGVMGIDYPTAGWLQKELGYKAYRVESVEELRRPFESLYFGAAYLAWLSHYEGRERSPQFVVQAYLSGPQNAANVPEEETGPNWLKFLEALSHYCEGDDDFKKELGFCTIL